MGARLPKGVANGNSFYTCYIRDAKKRSIDFLLTKDDFLRLTKLDCHYCGSKPSLKFKSNNHGNGSYICNGIDRKNNLVGYIIDNCVPCCNVCNRMKGKLTEKVFLTYIARIYTKRINE